jgi:hypothetical protein
MKKIFAMLLALTMLLSLIPMSVAADAWTDYASFKPINADKYLATKHTGETTEISTERYEELMADFGAYLAYLEEQYKAANHDPNNHSYNGYGSDTKYHWLQCACGCKISEELHIDPKNAPNDMCFCGYQFSDNADLTVLWIEGAFPIKNFNKDVTEYEVKAHTYKDFKEVKISTFTHDSEATVEYPADLTLKDGKNVYEIKVTSENQKVTKVYTVTVVK